MRKFLILLPIRKQGPGMGNDQAFAELGIGTAEVATGCIRNEKKVEPDSPQSMESRCGRLRNEHEKTV